MVIKEYVTYNQVDSHSRLVRAAARQAGLTAL
jgi:hypothetical protein